MIRDKQFTEQIYYPFGMMMPHPQNTQPGGHKFGFQGQLADDELHGNQNSYAFKARMHDPRIGRFMSIDPVAKKYPHNSPYAFSENRVMDGREYEGKEWVHYRVNSIGKDGQASLTLRRNPYEFATWGHRAIYELFGVNIQPFKVYVVHYDGKGYLYTEQEFNKMVNATISEIKNREFTIQEIKGLTQAISMLSGPPKNPISAASHLKQTKDLSETLDPTQEKEVLDKRENQPKDKSSKKTEINDIEENKGKGENSDELNNKGNSENNMYRIREDDTFWSIAQEREGVTVNDLRKANPNVDEDDLKVNQKINIPDSGEE